MAHVNFSTLTQAATELRGKRYQHPKQLFRNVNLIDANWSRLSDKQRGKLKKLMAGSDLVKVEGRRVLPGDKLDQQLLELKTLDPKALSSTTGG